MCRLAHIRVFFAALVLFALAVVPVCADVVVLNNGESLSGTFSRIRNNTLIFRTSMQGQLMTPMSEVRTLSADKILCITLVDGRVHYGRLGVEERQQKVFLLNGEDSVSIDASAIQETLPIPTPPAGVETGIAETLTIESGAGAQWRSDSDSSVAPTVRLSAKGNGENWRFDAGAVAEHDDSESFPTYLRAQADFFGKGDGKAMPYVGMETERDLDRLLELRQHLTLGLYRALYVTNRSAMGILAGMDLGYLQEQAPEKAAKREKGSLNARLGLRYYRLLSNRHALRSAVALLPSVTNAEGFRARAETVYTMPMTDRLQLRLELIIGYDNDPLTSNINRWNATIGAGVNLAF